MDTIATIFIIFFVHIGFAIKWKEYDSRFEMMLAAAVHSFPCISLCWFTKIASLADMYYSVTMLRRSYVSCRVDYMTHSHGCINLTTETIWNYSLNEYYVVYAYLNESLTKYPFFVCGFEI